MASLILAATWFAAAILLWLASGLISPIHPNESIVVGWGDDCRNRTCNLVSGASGALLALYYLRRTRKRGRVERNPAEIRANLR